MKRVNLLPLIVAASICSILLGFSPSSFATTATNLVTICTSATTTIQASKCTAWQYNVYSPTAYIESYPQVSPGTKGYTDPLYEYRLGSSINSTMGVKVCPTALVPGTSFNTPQADPCPNNVLVSASTVIPSHYMVAVGSSEISVFSIINSQLTPLPGSPYSLSALSLPYPDPSLTWIINAVLIGSHLYVVTGCCSPHAPSTLYSYDVSSAGLTFVDGVQTNFGTSISIPIAVIPTQGYIYFVNVGYGTVPSYLNTVQVSNGSMTEVDSFPGMQLSCNPQSASLDATGSYLFINCGTEVEVISLVSPGNPVQLTTQTADAGIKAIGN